jgi:predicted enzyme related to lactoylglutathione lyase
MHGSFGETKIPVKDLLRAADFYNTVFGWSVWPCGGNDKTFHFTTNPFMGRGFGKFVESKADVKLPFPLQLRVDNINECLGKVRDAGGSVIL